MQQRPAEPSVYLDARAARQIVQGRLTARAFKVEHMLRELLRNVQVRASLGQTSMVWEVRTRVMWLPVREAEEIAHQLSAQTARLGYASEVLFDRFVYVGWGGAAEFSDEQGAGAHSTS